MNKLKKEQINYMESFSRRDWFLSMMTNDPQFILWKYQKKLRISEEYYNRYKKSKTHIKKIFYASLFLITKARKNRLGNKISVDIRENSVGEGLVLYHNNIIINGHARIGKNCRLHGNNVIGNDGKTFATPRIGNNVDIGAGAVIIGDIEIADDIVIGAGAVVVNSFMTSGKTIVGVPAREI